MKEVEIIIIDEISLVTADLLEKLNSKLKEARRNDHPFGGVQIILAGDLYQGRVIGFF
jgi:ATP-dependent DNA helicase PIF1